MTLRWSTSLRTGVALGAIVAIGLFADFRPEPQPAVERWTVSPPPAPKLLDLPASISSDPARPARLATVPPMEPPGPVERDIPRESPPHPPWTAILSPGDTLDAVLRRAGVAPAVRAVFARAIQTEYDLANLMPGDRVVVITDARGRPREVAVVVSSGDRIVVRLEDEPVVQKVAPKLEMVEQAAVLTVDGSIYASFDRSGVPARFAIDLAQTLAGVVDVRRDLRGGERLRLLWRETRFADGSRNGAPWLAYVEFMIGNERIEIVWADEDREAAEVFRDGKRLRTSAPPVTGGRLVSVFGRRQHPVLGDVRMHTGVDYAAPRGTPVYATGPGRVAFIGRRNGYGLVVEIAHGATLMTRYSHLSSVAKGLEAGDVVGAGERIGSVGSSGLATGPNLHYEVRLDGRALDPLNSGRIATPADKESMRAARLALLDVRGRLAALIDEEAGTSGRATFPTRGQPS